MRFPLLALLAAAGPLQSPPATADDSCGEENLLAGRQPMGWLDIFRPDLVTDGIGARDGDPELGALSAVLASEQAFVAYDLGVERRLTAVLLQAAADASYTIEVSSDQRLWTGLVTAGPTGGGGMRTRVAKGLDARSRYLRLSARGGSGGHAVSEMQIFCRPPASPPLAIRPSAQLSLPQEVALAQSRRALLLLLPAGVSLFLLLSRRWSPRRDRLALLVAAFTSVMALAFTASNSAPGIAAACGGITALATWLVALATRSESPAPASPSRRTTAALLVGLAAISYTSYGQFGGYWSVHYHDVLHYMLGAKYAPELRYDGLYACLLESNSPEASFTTVTPAAVRDLRTGAMIPSRELLARGPCRARFSAARWQAFRQDASFFAGQLSPAGWVAVFADHGYNATPVWTWLWRPLFGDRPASAGWLEGLAHLDEVGYLMMVLLAVWAWGPTRAATAALLFGLGLPWIFLWTGGGVGRSLWLVTLVAGLALAARRRHFASGLALGISSAVQLFPTLILVGPLCLAWRRDSRQEAVGAHRILLAAGLAGAILVGGSCQVAGPSLWQDFARNMVRHLGADSANRIGPSVIATGLGLPLAVGWVWSAAALGVWAWAAFRARDLARLLQLAILVPIFALRLSSYYLAAVICLAPLLDTPGCMTAALLTLLAVPHVVGWSTGEALGPGAYAWMSLAIVGFGMTLCWLEARRSRQGTADA